MRKDLASEVVDHVPAMLAYWDKNQICRFSNAAYLEWFGKTREQMVDKITMKELLGSLYEKNIPFIEGALKGVPQYFEREIVIPSGEKRFSVVTYAPDVVNNEVNGFFVQVADITPIKTLENNLIKSEYKFRKLLESAPDAMVIVNALGKIELINSQTENLFGYKKEELIGSMIESLLPKRLSKDHLHHRQDFFAAPKTRAMGSGIELFAIKKNGDEFPVEISLGPLETPEGVLVSAAIRDISKRKETEDAMKLLLNQLTNQNDQLNKFAHVASHDLRAPVGNLKSLLEIYNKTNDKQEKGLIFSKFEIVIRHLSETLNELVEAIKIRDSNHIEFKKVSILAVLNTVKEILAGQIITTQAIITSNFESGEFVNCNEEYLKSILQNLLSNSLKYRSLDKNPIIHFQGAINNGKTLLTIEDNGIGIDLDKYGSKIFGLHQTFHLHPEAKGVGLFLVKMQVEAMGGSISVSSEKDKGTTFSISFKL